MKCQVLLILATAMACTAAIPGEDDFVLIRDVPHVLQKPDFCGEACVEMYLRKLGCRGMTQDYVFNQSGLMPAQARGCHTKELSVALRKIGFDIGDVGTWIPVKTAPASIRVEWEKLLADLRSKIPSIICTRYDDKPQTTEHFRLILGYDPKTDEVIYHEPAVLKGAYRRMARSTFFKLWPLKYRRDKWLLIRFRLRPVKVKRQALPSTVHTAADYAQAAIALKEKMPKDFTMVVQKPFLVAGDEKPATVRARTKRTIKWAIDMLKKDYFRRDPKSIITIWLFKDKASYRKHTKDLFNDNPDTPFGYFSSTHNALIMNIATGGGTLVHEMVHPFVDSNFPQCPSWFNEGLASLYEQCGERDGRITGFTNWRLSGLQKAIKKNRVPSFKTLCSTSTFQFYQRDPGTNYAQARYLCYYLQQRGALRTSYHTFAKNVAKDPTGYETLKSILGEEDMDGFKKKWETWVLKLTYP